MRFKFVITLLLSTFLYAQKTTSPIGFIENKGQIVDQEGKQNKNVKFLLNTSGLNVQLRNNGFSYDIYETKKISLTKQDKEFYSSITRLDQKGKTPDYSFKNDYHRIDIDFLNSNPSVRLIPEEKSADYDNYYTVAHAPQGITGVHKYQRVTYQNIYNHIDVVFFIPKDSTKAVEYNFIVKPGGKVSDIQMKFNGVKTELADNKIKMNVRFGKMEETLPLSWIEQGSSKKEIAVNYVNIKNNVYGFSGDVNASDKTIVIDPTPIRHWGTFYGGAEDEGRFYCSVKSFKDYVYLASYTFSSNNISTVGSYQNSISTPYDAFMAKFTPDGVRVWGTFYGGNHSDHFTDLTLDSNENIYCVGMTGSTNNIATTNSHQENYKDWYDGMLVKFDPNGYRIWGTYYGGQKVDEIMGIDIDRNNNLYIVGLTHSLESITTLGCFKPIMEETTYTNQMSDGFLVKFDLNGNRIWATYYGGLGGDYFESVDTDSNGNIFCTGVTHSRDQIATPGAFHTNLSENHAWTSWPDSFMVKFTPDGNRVFGTYYGGYDYDFNDCVKVDKLDNVLISGSTRSWNEIGTPGSHQPVNGGGTAGSDSWDAYLAKFDNNGQLLWSTYYGGEKVDASENTIVDIDENNDIYFMSSGESTTNIATPDAFDSVNGIVKVYLVKFNSNGQRIWGTYFGNRRTYSGDLSYDKNGIFYISGWTFENTDISTSGSHQPVSGGNTESYLVKFQDCFSSGLASSNSPICVGQNLQFNASGGTNYAWTGPNGFTSNDQNPIITNANATHSGQYSCTITGTSGGCDNTITVNVVVGDTIAPVPNITNLPIITGDCNTAVTTVPTATDHCAGVVNGTTTDALAYTIPGNYTIVWTYNDGNGNTSSQNQNITITATALPTASSSQQFCVQQNADLSDIAITGQNIQWYDASTGGNLLASNTLLQNGVTYHASQTINGCESARIPVTITIQNTPAPTGSSNQSFCASENATLNNIAIAGTGVLWYASTVSTQPLAITTLLADNTIYYATQTINGCESVTRLAVSIDLITTLNATDYSENLCDDLNNGSETVNLTNYNTQLIVNSTNYTFKYYTTSNGATNQTASDEITNFTNYNLSVGSRTIYIRITSSNSCFQIVALHLTLFSKPVPNISGSITLCEGSSMVINAGAGFDGYLWSTGATTPSITVTTPGNYSVSVSQNHGSLTCTTIKNFQVVNSNAATISQIITSDWTTDENAITVMLASNSVGNYEYSLDGINYQSSNMFTRLKNGEYTVYIRDKNGCGITDESIYLLMHPKFFTPNGDGYNDYWRIKLSEYEPHFIIKIFDRYGKLLKVLTTNNIGWDGTFNGQPLPATDYWFTVTRENGKEHRGHFTLKR